jgi:hypothetical protein
MKSTQLRWGRLLIGGFLAELIGLRQLAVSWRRGGNWRNATRKMVIVVVTSSSIVIALWMFGLLRVGLPDSLIPVSLYT